MFDASFLTDFRFLCLVEVFIYIYIYEQQHCVGCIFFMIILCYNIKKVSIYGLNLSKTDDRLGPARKVVDFDGLAWLAINHSKQVKIWLSLSHQHGTELKRSCFIPIAFHVLVSELESFCPRDVSGCLGGVSGCLGVSRGVSGCLGVSRGCLGGVSGVSRGVSGVSLCMCMCRDGLPQCEFCLICVYASVLKGRITVKTDYRLVSRGCPRGFDFFPPLHRLTG